MMFVDELNMNEDKMKKERKRGKKKMVSRLKNNLIKCTLNTNRQISSFTKYSVTQPQSWGLQSDWCVDMGSRCCVCNYQLTPSPFNSIHDSIDQHQNQTHSTIPQSVHKLNQFNPIESNVIQPNPTEPNPIQSSQVQFNPIQFNLIQHGCSLVSLMKRGKSEVLCVVVMVGWLVCVCWLMRKMHI